MSIRMLDVIQFEGTLYKRAAIYYVTPKIGKMFIAQKWAEETQDPPEEIQCIEDKTTCHPKTLFLPNVGEFGHVIMSGIRIVHFNKSPHKIVCCRKGQEVLYPSATEFYTDWEDNIPDTHRIGSGRYTRLEWTDIREKFPDAVAVESDNLHPIAELVCIHPELPIPFKPLTRGLKADVVLGVRRREFCPERNWKHWQRLANAVTKAGYTFAVIGDLKTSFHLKGEVVHSGDYDTDCAIELLQNAKLYIGGDSGNSHLAAVTDVRMLVFREEEAGSRDLTYRMRMTNHTLTVLRRVWDKPKVVIDAALRMLSE
jgi:hypothetical protein